MAGRGLGTGSSRQLGIVVAFGVAGAANLAIFAPDLAHISDQKIRLLLAVKHYYEGVCWFICLLVCFCVIHLSIFI